MKQFLKNIKSITLLLVLLVALLLAGLFIQQKRSREELSAAVGENKHALRQRYSEAGSISSSDAVILAQSLAGERVYAKNPALAKACLHLVGDYTHRIANSIEALYMPELLGISRNFLDQLLLDVRGKGYQGNDLVLTVDSRLMLKADELLKGRRGSIVLVNYKSGDLLALANAPTLYPEDVIEWKNITEGSLFNRAFFGRYYPGSTFKMIGATSLLESNDLDQNMQVKCLGSTEIVAGGVKETLTPKGHGTVGLTAAFTDSCNAYFGKLAIALGRGRLTAASESFGFNDSFLLDRFKSSASKMELSEPGAGALSWVGAGQPIGEDKLTVSPLHLAYLAAAFANDGIMMKPNIILQEIDPFGEIKYQRQSEEYLACCRASTAAKMEELMLSVVNSGTGKKAQRKGLKIAGKTGTAEMVNAEGKIEIVSLFSGYLISDNRPYAIAVVLEDASGGAANIAGELLNFASKLKSP